MLGCVKEAIKKFAIPLPLLTIIQWEVLGITYFYYFPIISIILACCFNSFRRRQIESESKGLDSQDPKVWRCNYYDQFRPTIISHQKDRTWNKTSKRRQREPKFLRRFRILALELVMYLYYVCPTPVWVWSETLHGPKRSFNGCKNHYFYKKKWITLTRAVLQTKVGD